MTTLKAHSFTEAKVAIVPGDNIYGPLLSSAAGAQAGVQGLFQGLGDVASAIQSAAAASAEARKLAAQDRGEALKSMAENLTYGGKEGGALQQALSMPAPTQRTGGGGRGGRGGAVAPSVSLAQVEAEAERLDQIARALDRQQQMPSPLRDIEMMTPGGFAVPEGEQGMRNVAAERLGLSPRQIVRPETLLQVAELLRRGDPSTSSFLTAYGLPQDMSQDDLRGLAAEAKEYQSRLAARVPDLAAQLDTGVDLSGRAKLMEAQLRSVGYDAGNIDEVALELARLTDEDAYNALKLIGRPGEYSQAIKKAGIEANSISRIIYSGLKDKFPTASSTVQRTFLSSKGFNSLDEVNKAIDSVNESLAAILKAYPKATFDKYGRVFSEFPIPENDAKRIENLKRQQTDLLNIISESMNLGSGRKASTPSGRKASTPSVEAETVLSRESDALLKEIKKKAVNTPASELARNPVIRAKYPDIGKVKEKIIDVMTDGKTLVFETESGIKYRGPDLP